MIVSYGWILLILPLNVFSNDTDTNLLIETNTGLVRGKTVIGKTKKEAHAFYGIPYAEPPIGKLRFKPPMPVIPWTGVLDATRTALPCYQQYTKETLRLSKKLGIAIRRPWSEDCLTLNIWRPAVVPHEAPVIVMVHDGNFVIGSGSYPYIDFSTLATETEMISISFNYRLAAFGFLSLGIPEIPGNLGLMDQQLALKWIHNNVHKFGGKTEAKILWGLGAGAASIGHQMLLSENKDLFKTAMFVDGSPTCSWSWQTNETAVRAAKRLSRNLDCDHSNLTDEIECLQNAHPEDILGASLLGKVSQTDGFKPKIDGWFIKEPPDQAMKSGKMNNVTVISCSTENAGSLEFFNLNEDVLRGPVPSLNVAEFQQAIKRSDLARNEVELDMIRDWYVGNNCTRKNNSSIEIREAAVRAYSDGLSRCCSDEFLKLATEHNILTFKIVYGIPDPKFPPWIGAHSLIVQFVLTAEHLNTELSYGHEIRNWTLTSLRAVKLYGRKKAREFRKLVPLYNLQTRPYMYRKDKAYHLKNYSMENCILWNQILPALRDRQSSSLNGHCIITEIPGL